MHRTVKVTVQHPAELRHVDLGSARILRAAFAATSVADQHIQPTPRMDHLVDSLLDRGLVSHVGPAQHGRTTQLGYRRAGTGYRRDALRTATFATDLLARSVVAVEYRDRGTEFGQVNRHSATDPPSPTGHEGNFMGQRGHEYSSLAQATRLRNGSRAPSGP